MFSFNHPQHHLAAAIDRHELRRDAHFVGMSLIAVVVCMQFLSAIPLMILAGAGVLDLTQENYGLSGNGYDLLNMGLYLLTLAPPVVVTALLCRQKINPFADRQRVDPVSFLCLIGIGLAVCILSNYIANFIAGILGQFGVGWPDITGDVKLTVSSLVINLIATAILPGICEELVFRGYILQALRRYGDGFAVVVSALLFGLLHGNVLQIPFALIVGLICGYVVVQTGNLWVAVVLHTLNNAMSVILTAVDPLLTPSGSTRLNVTVSLLLVLIGVAGFLGLKVTDSPLLERPSGGWTSLSTKDKWSGLFASPAFIVCVVVLVLMTLFNTMAYSLV